MQSPESRPEQNGLDKHEVPRLARTLFWVGLGIGVAAVGATQRIQELIDEANSLLKALDEQRNSA